VHDAQKLVGLERLGKERDLGQPALLEGVRRAVRVAAGHDDRQVGPLLANVRHEVDAAGGSQMEIDDQKPEGVFGHHRGRFGRGRSADRVTAGHAVLDEGADRVADVDVVVDDKDSDPFRGPARARGHLFRVVGRVHLTRIPSGQSRLSRRSGGRQGG
jgi:hypothetical protein